MSQNQNTNDLYTLLKNISAQDFRNLGTSEVAYVKPAIIQDKTLYIIHGADGKTLSVMNKMEEALTAIRHNDLEPVTLQ